MLRFLLSVILSTCICTLAFAGETAFTKITKTKLAGGSVQIDAEGTNELDVGEKFNGWTPVFVKPDTTIVPAKIVEFRQNNARWREGKLQNQIYCHPPQRS